MTMVKTFPRGGVHPPACKITAESPIRTAPLPPEVIIPLSQHIGAPATPIVKAGDKVLAGQCIAEAGGFVSAPVHSSVSGTVVKVDAFPDVSGYRRPAVQIKVEDDVWVDTVDRTPDLVCASDLTPEDIMASVRSAGVVGMGGATFPLHVKLAVPQGKKAELLLVNAAECEPYLTCDHRVMLEHAAEVAAGVALLVRSLQVERAVIGIESNKPDAIAAMSAAVAGRPGISVEPLRVKYPQGGEKQLIKAITGREVPPGGLPVDVGVVPCNVGTALAVYEAVLKHKPLVERIVTVTGPTLAEPANWKVRIGTPFSWLVNLSGGMPEDTGKIISGGPMMGKAASSLEVPVTKGTSGILLLPASQSLRRPASPCIRCGRCVTVCPMGLEPYLLSKLSALSRLDEAEQHHIADCIECGSCSYTCPSARPLLDYIRLGKAVVMKKLRLQGRK